MVRVDIKKIKMEWLSVECLVTLSKIVQVAHEHDKTVLPLQSEELLRLVVRYTKTTDNIQLKGLYKELKEQIKTCLSDPELQSRMSNDHDEDELEEMSHVDYTNFAA